MRNLKLRFRNPFPYLTAVALLWVGPPAIAQTPQENPPAQPDQGQDRDELMRQEVASFDRFLDTHRQISEELRGEPSRVRNPEFLQKYPELQSYLQAHPLIREQLNANPDRFMRAEERFDYREQFGPRSTERDPDVTGKELASFDRFLDAHQQISQELRGDPSRIRNREFLEKYPELQSYLESHPQVREELNENPNSFMWAENNYDYREQRRDQTSAEDRGDVNNRTDRQTRPDDTTRSELANFDRFLDGHREIAEQVRRNPSLVRNGQFLQAHPQLQTYLDEHPAVRQQLSENPNAFMRAENRYEQREDMRQGGQTPRDRDMTHGEVVSFDQFLDHHREIAEQLRKDPSLVNNPKWVQDHPALQTYLSNHKNVREELTENPSAFMTAENRYDRRDDQSNRNQWNHDRDMDRSIPRGGQVASFREFLSSHSSLAQQLTKDPSLAKNQQFLQTHPELNDYLNAHPGVQSELTQNPRSFMKLAQENPPTTGKTAVDPNKPKP